LTSTLTRTTLDHLLALQFTVAWAGEALCEPPRLGWWRTDLVDEAGGGDLMARLLPRTHRWAALEAARRAAFLVDKAARQRMADEDAVRTLFFWGYETDEALADRLHDLKASEQHPVEALHLPTVFDRPRLEAGFKALAPDAAWSLQPTGREMKAAMPSDLARAAEMLASGLTPFRDAYVPAFFRR